MSVSIIVMDGSAGGGGIKRTPEKLEIRIIYDAVDDSHCKPLFGMLKIPTVVNLYVFELLFSYALK